MDLDSGFKLYRILFLFLITPVVTFKLSACKFHNFHSTFMVRRLRIVLRFNVGVISRPGIICGPVYLLQFLNLDNLALRRDKRFCLLMFTPDTVSQSSSGGTTYESRVRENIINIEMTHTPKTVNATKELNFGILLNL